MGFGELQNNSTFNISNLSMMSILIPWSKVFCDSNSNPVLVLGLVKTKLTQKPSLPFKDTYI